MDCVDWLTGLGCKNLNTKKHIILRKTFTKLNKRELTKPEDRRRAFNFFSPESVTPRAGEKFTQDNLTFQR